MRTSTSRTRHGARHHRRSHRPSRVCARCGGRTLVRPSQEVSGVLDVVLRDRTSRVARSTLVRPVRRARARLEAILTREREQRRVEAHGVALALECTKRMRLKASTMTNAAPASRPPRERAADAVTSHSTILTRPGSSSSRGAVDQARFMGGDSIVDRGPRAPAEGDAAGRGGRVGATTTMFFPWTNVRDVVSDPHTGVVSRRLGDQNVIDRVAVIRTHAHRSLAALVTVALVGCNTKPTPAPVTTSASAAPRAEGTQPAVHHGGNRRPPESARLGGGGIGESRAPAVVLRRGRALRGSLLGEGRSRP